MHRTKLIVALTGLFVLSVAGCGDPVKPSAKSSTPVKTAPENKANAAEGSGTN